MNKIIKMFFVLMMMAVLTSGCLVAESRYLVKVDEAENLAAQVTALTAENTRLKEQIAALTGERNELDRILKARTDDLSQTVSALKDENAQLKAELNALEQKATEVQKASNTYQELLQAMKAEIAKGEVTITELKGRLTVDVVDKILFASGQATVKKEGLEVLKRVVDILATVDDKNIRVEGHTDNVPITSRLSGVFPTNWELGAARAINVARYLQQQGINPSLLSATSFGEYQPIAENDTPEGRAKNRRIAIILTPRD